MRALLKLLVVLVFIAVLLLAALAMIDNQQSVALKFLDWQTFELSIYWWLLTALAVGFVLGWLLAGIAGLRRRAGARSKG